MSSKKPASKPKNVVANERDPVLMRAALATLMESQLRVEAARMLVCGFANPRRTFMVASAAAFEAAEARMAAIASEMVKP